MNDGNGAREDAGNKGVGNQEPEVAGIEPAPVAAGAEPASGVASAELTFGIADAELATAAAASELAPEVAGIESAPVAAGAEPATPVAESESATAPMSSATLDNAATAPMSSAALDNAVTAPMPSAALDNAATAPMPSTALNNAPSASLDAQNGSQAVKQKKKKAPIIAAVVAVLLLAVAGVGGFLLLNKPAANKDVDDESSNSATVSLYRMSGNALEDFDLAFLKLDEQNINRIYSPLSIKYALAMLDEAAAGESKAQITGIIGDYVPRSYPNSENMSFANALFVNSSFEQSIKESYIENLKNRFGATVLFDPFASPEVLNNWVKENTLGLIDGVADDVSGYYYVLVNALGIDMEWKNRIQPAMGKDERYVANYPHIDFYETVNLLAVVPGWNDYHRLDFQDVDSKVESVEIAAVANKYDILTELGEEKIRQTIREAYDKYLDEEDEDYAEYLQKKIEAGEPDERNYVRPQDEDEVVERTVQELGNGGYGDISSSTDFRFYDDDEIKMFAKELKEYDGITLEYVGIMPKVQKLQDYVKNASAESIGAAIRNLKTIELDNFKDGVITHVSGFIPLFNFDYDLDLNDGLKKLGVTDVFEKETADLSNLSSEPSYISKVAHKTTIDFSNDGIKAAASTADFGAGGSGGGFNYKFEVPIEEIDITFDKPYLFLIRDKNTGEVWFTGTVYEPTIIIE